jgi:DNA-binding helix-hairpin-helix protein with protein kinase domain
MDSLYKPGSRYETDTNQTITIIEKIDGGRGGEGEVWKTNIPGHLVKIFHDKLRTPELHRKLEILVKQSPQIDSPYNNHIPCAWPKNIIFESGKMVGCLIPLVKQPLSLVDIYSVKSRTKTKAISFSFKQALLLCIELSRIMDYLHQNEYVIGDMKPQNILVNSFFLPTIIDIDSIQVRDKFTRKFHRCVVGSDEFQPPELNNCTPKDVDQKPFHDHFRLAVIIHMILLGYHPFNGTLPDDPERKTQQNINEGIWCNSPPTRRLLMQRPHDIPISKLHKSIEKGFLKCFNNGHDDPTQRPSAKDWVDYLSLAIRDLNECFNVDNHYFASRNVSCFLCSRDIDNYPDLNLLH